ncbi:MAG: protein-L-isoaspartate(D-aspartate) O-methyltransferase [Candidatus Aenigmatarchaeota archaeon]
MKNRKPIFDEFREKREYMVSDLIANGYLKTEKIIKVFLKVPRHFFVQEHQIPYAYADYPLPIPGGQTISAPHMVAMMTELLEPKRSDKILEIGAGSGYQAAILAKLVRKVYTIEVNENLVEFAKNNLAKANIKNVEVIHADGSLGYPDKKPYDKIIVTCATPEIFDSWISQLKSNGIVLAPVGGGFYQELIRLKKTHKGMIKENYGLCAFVPLRSTHN